MEAARETSETSAGAGRPSPCGRSSAWLGLDLSRPSRSQIPADDRSADTRRRTVGIWCHGGPYRRQPSAPSEAAGGECSEGRRDIRRSRRRAKSHRRAHAWQERDRLRWHDRSRDESFAAPRRETVAVLDAEVEPVAATGSGSDCMCMAIRSAGSRTRSTFGDVHCTSFTYRRATCCDAAVGHLDAVFVSGFQGSHRHLAPGRIDVHLAHVVHDHGHLQPVRAR